MYFNQKYQERVSAQSEFENEIEQSIAIDNNIQADHEDSNNEQNYVRHSHSCLIDTLNNLQILNVL